MSGHLHLVSDELVKKIQKNPVGHHLIKEVIFFVFEPKLVIFRVEGNWKFFC